MVENALCKVANRIVHNEKVRPMKFVEQVRIHKGLPCAVLPIRPSPVVDGYRNKDYFMVGTGLDGNHKTVGFLVDINKEMKILNGHTKLQKEIHYEVSKCFETFIRSSTYETCGRAYWKPKGHWRNLMVRSNELNELLVQVVVHPFNSTRNELQKIIDEVHNFFQYGQGKCLGIKSLFWQECTHFRCYETTSVSFQKIYGSSYISETLFEFKFRISPNSFFQINKWAAEVLYNTVREIAALDKDTVLLDVCCGTGTIGIVLSKHVKKVYGLEIMEDAVNDAKKNAKLNGVANVEYIVGKAEKQLKYLIADLDANEKIVAVVNPARGGLGKSVVHALRKCANIRKIVYISCKPIGRASFNFSGLCKIDEGLGEPFVPTLAVPVDMFPHTRHYELVILFER